MSNHYFLHSVSSVHSANQDRDLSRAAAERYLILEASAERRAAEQTRRVHPLLAWLPRPVRAAWTRTRPAAAGAPSN